MALCLHSINGFYYCPLDVLTVNPNPVRPCDISVSPIALDVPIPHLQTPSKYKPVTKERQLELEVWSLCLGCLGKHQLDVLPGNVLGITSVLEYHPFWFIDFQAQALVRKQAAQRLSVRVEHHCKNFKWILVLCVPPLTTTANPQKLLAMQYIPMTDSSYLIIVNAATCFIWMFLTVSKEPPTDIVGAFMQQFALPDGGFVRKD
jgi:hypothetical protein